MLQFGMMPISKSGSGMDGMQNTVVGKFISRKQLTINLLAGNKFPDYGALHYIHMKFFYLQHQAHPRPPPQTLFGTAVVGSPIDFVY